MGGWGRRGEQAVFFLFPPVRKIGYSPTQREGAREREREQSTWGNIPLCFPVLVTSGQKIFIPVAHHVLRH